MGTIPKSAKASYATVPNSYEGLVTSACNDRRVSAIFGSSVTTNPDLWSAGHRVTAQSATPVTVAFSFYFPSAKQWAAGQRWFRCDIGSATQGSTDWRPAPAAFSSVLSSDPDFFAYCLDGKDPGGSAATGSTPVGSIAVCSTKTPWKLLMLVQLAKTEKESYPGISVARSRAEHLCPTTPHKRYINVPVAFGWNANGITNAECWEYDAHHQPA